MIIRVINNSALTAEAVAEACAAVQAQVQQHVWRHWFAWAELRPGADAGEADADLELLRVPPSPENLGEHWADGTRPKAWVGVGDATGLGDWTVTLSHEVLEMVVNPRNNRLVIGPPDEREVFFYAEEICDPVDADSYTINGVQVADFVLPSWFVPGSAESGHTWRASEGQADADAVPQTPRRGGFALYVRGSNGQRDILRGEAAPSWAADHLALRGLLKDLETVKRLRG